jgi:hypothetical protein
MLPDDRIPFIDGERGHRSSPERMDGDSLKALHFRLMSRAPRGNVHMATDIAH